MYESEQLWRAKAGRPAPSAGLAGWLFRAVLMLALAGGGLTLLVSMRGEIGEATRDLVAKPRELAAAQRAGEADGGRAADDGFDREIVLPRSGNGHFLVKAFVNGVEVRFLVDTGASDVALTAEDAKRIGINLSRLKYTREYQTANGIIRAAPITLRDLRIAQLRVDDVRATVSEAPMGISLLGMSFLGELSGYEVRGDRMILRW